MHPPVSRFSASTASSCQLCCVNSHRHCFTNLPYRERDGRLRLALLVSFLRERNNLCSTSFSLSCSSRNGTVLYRLWTRDHHRVPLSFVSITQKLIFPLYRIFITHIRTAFRYLKWNARYTFLSYFSFHISFARPQRAPDSRALSLNGPGFKTAIFSSKSV